MIPVSEKWKSHQNELLQPETFVEITYTVTEPGLQGKASLQATLPGEYSNTQQVLDITDKYSDDYATLDYGNWGLDGSYDYEDGTPVDPGYISSVYSEDTTVYPVFTINFAQRHDVLIPGITVTWDVVFGSWASDFRVTAYYDTSVVAQKTVTGNTSIVCDVFMDLVGYNKITIEVLGWSHPFQRIRCMEIFLGIRKIYEKADLLGFEHSQSVDLLAAVLPVSSVTFKLRNDDNRWNPDNPVGHEKYLAEQQEVRVRYGMDIDGAVEWINCGTFWLSEWSTPANGLEAVFTARDAVDFMAAIYTGPTSGTLYDIAVAALEEANLSVLDDGSVRYSVSNVLDFISTDFTREDGGYTIAEVLQMVAHAGGCVFYQDRNGVVRIEPRSREDSGYSVEPMISYTHPEYVLTKPLKAVSVGYGENLRAILDVAAKGEIQTVDNPLIVTEEDAIRVATNTKEVLGNRKTISGEFRADLRMDALDNIVVVSKYAANRVAVTDVTYSTTGGTFKSTYTGRVEVV